jgi:uncharacterized cupin superfamily protein
MARVPVQEATLVRTEAGLRPDDDGWFVVNAADSTAVGTDAGEYGIHFEGTPRRFPHFGINITILEPGRPAAMYHAEARQETFLVLHGECVLVIEEHERRLRQWDFVYCPPRTAHVLIGVGDGPCALLMVGARHVDAEITYPVSPLAARHGASVEEETTEHEEAYASWQTLTPRRAPWPLACGRPLGKTKAMTRAYPRCEQPTLGTMRRYRSSREAALGLAGPRGGEMTYSA